MSIVLTRIDYRLLHGIVATQWAPKSNAERIMIIDDKIANDPVLKNSMKMARPGSMAISIITMEKAVNNLNSNKYGNQKIFLVVRDVKTLDELVNKTNIKLDDVNFGSTDKENHQNNIEKKISKFVELTNKEVNYLNSLIDKGIKFYSRYLYNDESIDLNKIIKGEN
jgi:PTS system mannose-specific IIB component